MKCRHLVFIGLCCILVGGCKSAYYSTLERLGVHKRDILVDRVEEARETQEDTKEQFKDALESILAATDYKGSDLKDIYDRLSAQLARSEAQADEVRDSISAIEEVAEDLFSEWEIELDQYINAELKSTSQKRFWATRKKYDALMDALRKTEAKIDPILSVFRDQVLFLKHNLNARAVSALEDVSVDLQKDIEALIKEMEASIEEANRFINIMK